MPVTETHSLPPFSKAQSNAILMYTDAVFWRADLHMFLIHLIHHYTTVRPSSMLVIPAAALDEPQPHCPRTEGLYLRLNESLCP